MDDITWVDNSNLVTAGVDREAKRTLSRKPETKKDKYNSLNYCLIEKEVGEGEREKKRVFSVESFRGTCIRIGILSTLKSYDKRGS